MVDAIVSRISGPVVVASGLENAKMYDVVRIGELGLVGEIIRLEGSKATVQVYEDTTGLRPGEKVINTNRPLSIQLGPGLLTSIYDGIQRPLDVLREQSGDFISRGKIIPALNQQKKWEFIPVKKKGDNVSQGEVIGEVQETPLIKHKIMMPHDLNGKLVEISEGKFTVNEIVATVQTNSSKMDIGLSSWWMVRSPRPVLRKLPPEAPLLTGQRVLDTFFPVAKGGTAAIPGPFGSGKCVTGDTPVVLGDGSLTTMEDLYNSASKNASMITEANNECLVDLKEPIKLYSFKDGKIVESKSNVVYRGMTDYVLEIKTRTGKRAKITPVHKLFKIDDCGSIVETMAQDLKIGDFVASVRKLNVDSRDCEIEFSKTYDARYRTKVSLPKKLSPELAEFLGLFIAEGYIRGDKIVVFTNSDEKLLDRFIHLGRSLFRLEGKIERQKGKTPNVLLSSIILVDFVKFLTNGTNAYNKELPGTILRSSDASVRSFLAGYYLGDGSYYDGKVELSTASERLCIGLSYALARMGVTHSITERFVDGKRHHRIFMRGKDNLSLLYNQLSCSSAPRLDKIEKIGEYTKSVTYGWRSIDIVPLSRDVLTELYNTSSPGYAVLEKEGIEISNYITNGELMSVQKFKTFASVQEGEVDMLQRIFSLSRALDHIMCDEIVEIKRIDGPMPVYDVSTPEFGSNFVGGFGGMILHNTVTQQQLAKWADSDVIVYVGCGERGNEMTEVLTNFPKLEDPKSKRPLMERTILVANTSNMPVAAREASIYTGITMGEYYRDMGYGVALMADSTSRWAEALREISGRLEEMPGEEGYPAYLGRKLSEFYERGGKATIISPEERIGSLTLVGAVSPPGGDFSEPVSQNTLRVTRVFWALDASLASRRHFPSINWLTSYSLYADDMNDWYKNNVGKEWISLRREALEILQRESELQEIVQLVGYDALPEPEKGVLDTARSIREDYLQQSAYDEIDTYTSIRKQYRMLAIILEFGRMEADAITKGITSSKIGSLEARKMISKIKWTSEDKVDQLIDEIRMAMNQQFASLLAEGAG